MPMLPKKPSGYLSDTIGAIIDYLKAITPLSHPDHMLEFTPSGVYIKNKGRDNAPTSGLDYKPFRADYQDPDTILINGGRYTLGGSTVFNKGDVLIKGEGDDGGIEDDVGTGLVAESDYTVYLEKWADPLAVDPDDATIKPTALYVYCVIGDMPADGAMRHKKMKICTFSTDASAKIVESSVKDGRKHIGDVDEVTVVPDGNLDPAPTVNIKTLEFLVSDQGQLQMNDADSLTLAGGQDWDADSLTGIPILTKAAGAGGSLRWIGTDTELDAAQNDPGSDTQRSIEISVGAGRLWFQLHGIDQAVAEPATGYQELCFRRSGLNAAPWETWFLDSSKLRVGEADAPSESWDWSAISHGLLTDRAVDSQGHSIYLLLNDNAPISADAARNSMSGVIGDAAATPVVSIKPNDRILCDASGNNSVNWASRYLHHSTGYISVDWEGYTLFGPNQTDGYLCWNGAGSWALYFIATNKWDATQFLADTTGKFELIAGASSKLEVTGDLSLKPSGALNFGTDAGISITGWSTKGGLTGADIIEISQGDILPTDKILVRRA